ncbi:MAG TPA: PAS domain-containing protein [Methanomassiliicoccales archaeon]|jgi:PAS domain S-box-containing protein|nr:PAS domain-containing protein [Methanomassiliicoccales archaeon]
MIGNLKGEVLESVLETIPIEFSVLDENDKVVAWNKHDSRVFKRPSAVLGRDVRNCHPKKSLDKVEAIIGEMRQGKREKARFWIDMHAEGGTRKIMIEYHALRGKDGRYLGCLEATQDVTEIQALKGEKRLLD